MHLLPVDSISNASVFLGTLLQFLWLWNQIHLNRLNPDGFLKFGWIVWICWRFFGLDSLFSMTLKFFSVLNGFDSPPTCDSIGSSGIYWDLWGIHNARINSRNASRCWQCPSVFGMVRDGLGWFWATCAGMDHVFKSLGVECRKKNDNLKFQPAFNEHLIQLTSVYTLK